MLERREALAKLMTEEQGKPIRMARNEVGYAADFLLWFAEEAKRVYGETIPSARADQRFLVLRQPVGVVARDHAVELPGVDAHPEDRARRSPPAARSCSSRPSRRRCSRSRCSRSSRTIELPAGVVNLVTTARPRDRRPRAGEHPTVRKITFTGSTEVGQAHRASRPRRA